MISPLRLSVLCLPVLLSGACSNKPAPEFPGSSLRSTYGEEDPEEQMDKEEAEEVLAELRQKYGVKAPGTGAAPGSIAEVLEIIAADDVPRFRAASDFASTQGGVEALSVRALLELSWADLFGLVGAVMEEMIERETGELRLLVQQGDLTNAQEARKQELEESRSLLKRAVVAISVLAKPHTEAGGQLALEAIRENQAKPEGYLASAYYYRMRRDWVAYDKAMDDFGKLKDREFVVADYIRAMESLERRGSESRARDAMEAVVSGAPEFVRAQACLVFLQEDLEDTHAELEKLRAIAPEHPLVSLTGGVIDSNYATTREVREAMDK